jgi:hypothetical protein
VRISVTEWSVLKLALRLPRALMNPELLARTLRAHAGTRRGAAAIGVVLLMLLVFLHLKTAAPAVTRLTGLVAQLAGAKLIDARWDAGAVQARTAGPVRASAIREGDLAYVQRALDAATVEARTTALRTSLAELKKYFVEKADVLRRFERAGADSRQALEAAMRADAAIVAHIKAAWKDFGERERLIAAENLAVRVIAEAQRYHYVPTAARRVSLESYLVDLPRVKSLPRPIQTGLERLEADVHRILLLKPLEHVLAERLASLRTAERLEEAGALFQRELDEAIEARDRWRVALIAYTLGLLVLAAYLGVRAIARYRDLEVLYAGRTRDLAKALHKLKALGADAHEPHRKPREPGDEDAQVLSEK